VFALCRDGIDLTQVERVLETVRAYSLFTDTDRHNPIDTPHRPLTSTNDALRPLSGVSRSYPYATVNP
jgi:hypothetical protein